jgi:uncharacterized caspase-like protein
LKKALFITFILYVLYLQGLACAIDTPVKTAHLNMIESLFLENGLKEAHVEFDKGGRVELRGRYRNEKEVNLAFSLAQTVVGVKWVSPVKPENIEVPGWAEDLSRVFPTNDKKKPSSTTDSTQPGPVATKYAIVMGVGRFQEKKITPLQYAEKDSKDFYNYLINPRGGNFKRENVFLLTNEKATRANIQNAFNNVRKKAERDDLVILYFSSHGTPPDKFGGVYIVTYDTVVKPRQSVWETAVTDEMLRDFIEGVKAKRLIVVMDACYSNGAYKQVEGFLPPGGKSLGADDEEGFGNSKDYMAKKILGAKDIVLDDEPSDATNSLQDGWGKVLFGASDSGEKSWESDTLKNSFFTHYFIEGLEKNNGDVKQAFEYAKPKVTTGVMKEKEAEQHPQVVADKKEWNIAIGK